MEVMRLMMMKARDNRVLDTDNILSTPSAIITHHPASTFVTTYHCAIITSSELRLSELYILIFNNLTPDSVPLFTQIIATTYNHIKIGYTIFDNLNEKDNSAKVFEINGEVRCAEPPFSDS